MAYAGTTVAVTPSGKIFPCEHIKDEDCLGDIFNCVTNTNVIEKWQFFDGEEINFCKETKCPYFPLCPQFYHCDTATLCSTIEQKNIRVNKGSYKLLRTKKFYDNKKLELLQKKEEKNLSKE
jgi:radical SAM protein with 4Fe4S-binding SPASM domain